MICLLVRINILVLPRPSKKKTKTKKLLYLQENTFNVSIIFYKQYLRIFERIQLGHAVDAFFETPQGPHHGLDLGVLGLTLFIHVIGLTSRADLVWLIPIHSLAWFLYLYIALQHPVITIRLVFGQTQIEFLADVSIALSGGFRPHGFIVEAIASFTFRFTWLYNVTGPSNNRVGQATMEPSILERAALFG